MNEYRRQPALLWALINVGFATLVIVLALVSGQKHPRLLYLCLLFGVCSSPVVYGGSFNSKYCVLWAVLPLYFIFYCASDLLSLVFGVPSIDRVLLSGAEIAILVGTSLLVTGYIASARWIDIHDEPRQSLAWQDRSILIVGLILWLLGLISTWYWQVQVIRAAFEMNAVKADAGMILTLGRMLYPLGMILLSYLWVVKPRRSLALVMVVLIVVELIAGFLCDSKEIGLQGIVILVLVKTLIDGRVPKMWVAAAGVCVIAAFPVFQAYRYDVLSAPGQARASAVHDFGKNFHSALQSGLKNNFAGDAERPGFLARISLKPTMELIVERVGHTAPYEKGKTLALLFSGFIPRIVWPDKPDTSVGQYFNRQLKISEFPDAYISVTQLGEFYWNFGWLGVVLGMMTVGVILGYVGRRCALDGRKSLGRLLVVVVTIYTFGLRFEGNIALQGVVWVRSLVAIAILNWLFAKSRPSGGSLVDTKPLESLALSATLRPSNLMH